MIIGAYYLTELVEGDKGEGRVFGSVAEALQAYEAGDISLHAKINLREPTARNGSNGDEEAAATRREGTLGRFLFDECLPAGFGYITETVKKKQMGEIVDRLANDHTKAEVATSLDGIKDLCFSFAARSGLTISIDDVTTPAEKRGILDDHEKEADKVEQQFRKGIITDGERRQKEVEIWTNATDKVREAMERGLSSKQFNPIDMMVGSGARGNMMQVRQIAGMRGLVANPRGDMIPRPIKSNFREGLSMLEYFIATPGARKGLVDTALRTADSGYLTRRLVDVAQELIIREPDCQREGDPVRGLWVEGVVPDTAGERSYLETRIFGRTLAVDVKLSDGTVLKAGNQISEEDLDALRDDPEVDRVRVRSVLTCQSDLGVCAACYGRSLATGKGIELGEAVGVIAAQSIGEPGTQLTMRTFHTGGIAGTDIAGGLPRVVELFEARSPKGKATLARTSGVVRLADDEGKGRVITIVGDDGSEDAYTVPSLARLQVTEGQEITAGDPIVDGPRDPKELLEIKGVRETQQYLVQRGAARVPRPGRVDPRQAHRADRPPDDQAGGRAGAGRQPVPAGRARRPEGLRRRQPPARAGGQEARRGPPRDDGHHQGLAGHRLVAVRRLLPGDDAGAHRGGHRVPVRQPARAEGEHHHRQADPGRHRQLRATRTSRRRLPTTSRWTTGAPRPTTRTSPSGSARATRRPPSAARRPPRSSASPPPATASRRREPQSRSVVD